MMVELYSFRGMLKTTEIELNRLARDGWELVSMTPFDLLETEDMIIYRTVVKRLVTKETKSATL